MWASIAAQRRDDFQRITHIQTPPDLADARTWAEWIAAAEEHDRISGAEAWRAEDDSPVYDAVALSRAVGRLRRLREAGDGIGLGAALTDELPRHLGDIGAPELYTRALAGMKHLVDRILDEVTAALRWLADTDLPGMTTDEKLRRFEAGWQVFGRSALLLSGGATWGFYHLGVVKGLLEQDLLPHILSGSSTGALVAAGACTRTDEELRAILADPSAIRLDGLRFRGWRGALREGSLLDPEQMAAIIHHNVGELTFAEAWARSGRSLNVSVSPTRHRQKPRLLNHLTAADVLVARAALASCALPGLYPPVELQARTHDGRVVPFIQGERWADGSLYGDLPKMRLARLHNVNHFIVSQANPHVVPLVRHNGQRGLRASLAGVTGATARSHGSFVFDLLRRASPGKVGLAADHLHALVSQDYRGDIDIHPRLPWALARKVVVNPSRQDLDAFIAAGERAVWPVVPRVRAQTRIGRTFRACVLQLRAALVDPPQRAT